MREILKTLNRHEYLAPERLEGRRLRRVHSDDQHPGASSERTATRRRSSKASVLPVITTASVSPAVDRNIAVTAELIEPRRTMPSTRASPSKNRQVPDESRSSPTEQLTCWSSARTRLPRLPAIDKAISNSSSEAYEA